MTRRVRMVTVAVLVALFVVVAVQNATTVSLRFLFWEVSSSLLVWLIGSLAIGFAVGFLTALMRR